MLFAVPVPRRAVPTVPLDKFDAFSVVKFAPDTAPKEPDHVPLVTVPTVVKLDVITPEANVVPVSALASTDGVAHVLSPRKKTVLSAVPVPSLAVPTVPLDRLDAFKVVRFAPDTAPKSPDHVPEVTVPTVVKLDVTTFAARVVPVKVPAAAVAVGTCHVPSPRKNVVLSAVPVPSLAVPTVPVVT